MTPRVISKDEVRVGDRVRVTYEEPGLVVEQTITVAEKGEAGRFYYGDDRLEFIYVNNADTITLLERPKPQFKVGDRVRRENPSGVTIEFTVHRVDSQRIYPQWGANPEAQDPGLGYSPERFELVQ